MVFLGAKRAIFVGALMARANRHYIPGHIWHITHRCHKREFLLRFAKDRQLWLRWLWEARRRFGLTVLNHMVTSNHIHLIVFDEEGGEVIPKSMQLVAGRTAQHYNERKGRNGAFWQDRYHATAVESGEHLLRCLIYIDLNMVRAGVVRHPSEWPLSGYNEIQQPRRKCKLIAYDQLQGLLDFETYEQLKVAHRSWVDEALKDGRSGRDARWSESIAVGSEEFVERTKEELGIRAKSREVMEMEGQFALREPGASYGGHFEAEKSHIGLESTYFWKNYGDNSEI
jgi:putative transposase